MRRAFSIVVGIRALLMRSQQLLIVLVAGSALAGCSSPAPDMQGEQAAVRKVVDDFATVLDTKDMDLFSTIMAHDSSMVAFGTDASERWVGYDAIRNAVEAQLAAFDSVTVTTRDQVIHLDPSASVAWFSEVSDWKITSGDTVVDLSDVRLTGVLENRLGHWVFVQFHTSLPVQGQAVAY